MRRYYDRVFDRRWIQSDDNETSRSIFEWREEINDRLIDLSQSMESACTNYIMYVRNYIGGYTEVPSYDKKSSNVFNAQARRAAAAENLERFKRVLDHIFQECQARAREHYETSMRRYHPTENSNDLYASSLFTDYIAWPDELKQRLLARKYI